MTDFTDNSSAVLSAADAAIARALEIIGGKCESYAKALCPVDTGALRNSITHRVDGDTVTVGSGIQYAPYVELGTGKEYQPGPEWIQAQARRGRGLDHWVYFDQAKGEFRMGFPQKPRPFLRPAVEEHKQEYENILRSELQNG